MNSTSIPGVGDVIAGRYELVEEIGRGGFGIIFRARQDRSPHEVALKLMDCSGTPLGPEEMRRRFRREAIMASNLVHPHAVRQLDFGEHQGLFYLSMELVRGETVGDRIKREKSLSTSLVIAIGRAVLDVLQLAHHKGIVHRDLKPDNIMLCEVAGRSDFPKVLDFGAAKTVHGDHDLTSAGTALGSPAYMAPEILMGESPTPATDIYALGLTLGEAIIGRKVVPGQTSIERAQNQISPDPLDVPEKLRSHELYPWLRRALEKKAEQRYPSAEAMLQKLDEMALSADIATQRVRAASRSIESTIEMDIPRGDDEFDAESTTLVEFSAPGDGTDDPRQPGASTDTDDDFEPEATELVGPPDAAEDFHAETTVMMSPDGEPAHQDDPLAALRREMGDDTAPTEQIEAPPGFTNRDGEFSAEKTEAATHPFFAPDDIHGEDTIADGPPLPGDDEAPTDPLRQAPDHHHRSRHHGESFAPDQPSIQSGESTRDYGSFAAPHEASSRGNPDQQGRSEFEPTAENDFKLIKTSDGRTDKLFLPVVITGAVVLVLVILLVYALAT